MYNGASDYNQQYFLNLDGQRYTYVHDGGSAFSKTSSESGMNQAK